MNDTVATANKALKTLGITLPDKVENFSVLFMLLAVRRKKARNKSDADILNLPVMSDPVMTAAIRMLLHIIFYYFLKDEDMLAVYTALLAMRLTLEHGTSRYSAGAFTIYGITELTFGKYQRGCHFGKLAQKMLTRFKCKEAECPTIAFDTAILAHWTTPIAELVDDYTHALQIGLEVGDVIYGFFCVSNIFGVRTAIGENLEVLEEYMSMSFRQTRDLVDDTMIM
jgi:predicted ATPase